MLAAASASRFNGRIRIQLEAKPFTVGAKVLTEKPEFEPELYFACPGFRFRFVGSRQEGFRLALE